MSRRMGPSEIQPDPWEPDQRIVEEAQEFYAAAVRRLEYRQSDEVFEQCLVCGEVDSHSDECFLPAMKRWLDKE